MIFVTFILIYRKYHISLYFLRKIIFHFPSKEKTSYFPEKYAIFPGNTRKILYQGDFFRKGNLIGAFEKNIIVSCIFWERSSFIFRLNNKIIFSGKRNIIFSDNTTKSIIFQCYFFGKTIFSEHLEKENMVFVQCLFILKFVTCFLLPFLMSVVSSWQFWLLLLLLSSSSTLVLAPEVFLGLTLTAAALVAYVLFELMLTVGTPVLLLVLLYAVRLLLKVSNLFLIHH